MTHNYQRNGYRTLYATLNTLTGKVIGQCSAKRRHQEFLALFKTAEKQTPAGLELHLIVDNYVTHKHEAVSYWLMRNKPVHWHFISTRSSWFKLVERFFGLLTEKQLRRGVFTSVKELETVITGFEAHHNSDPKPFVWTNSAEQILEKFSRER